MKTSIILSLTATLVFTACGQDTPADTPADTTGRSTAILSAEIDLADFQDCDVETPCPDGTECVALLDPDGGPLAICVEPGQACAIIECDGECIVAESYPVQLFCSSGDGGDDGDGGPVQSTTCGPVNCGDGLECCNALAGICVEPGEVCAL